MVQGKTLERREQRRHRHNPDAYWTIPAGARIIPPFRTRQIFGGGARLKVPGGRRGAPMIERVEREDVASGRARPAPYI